MDECGMLSADIVPCVGNGCTLPPGDLGRICQELQINDDVDIQRAGVRRHFGWTLGHQIARRQTSNQEDRFLPWAESAQQRDEDRSGQLTQAFFRANFSVRLEPNS